MAVVKRRQHDWQDLIRRIILDGFADEPSFALSISGAYHVFIRRLERGATRTMPPTASHNREQGETERTDSLRAQSSSHLEIFFILESGIERGGQLIRWRAHFWRAAKEFCIK